jgi:sensor histidine kinase YesM
MKKSFIILLHAGFWSCYSFLLFLIFLAAFQNIQGGPPINYVVKLSVCFAIIPSLISFYTFYFVVFPKLLRLKKFLSAALVGTGTAIGSGLIGTLVLTLTFGSDFMFKDGFNSFFGELLFMFFIALVCGVLGMVIKGFITWYDDLKIKEELTQKNHDMELALVKAQLDPHFLFNTINNIDVLILKDPNEASNYLNKLSDIMRFMLFETKSDKIELNKEVEYIEKYLALQKIRTSNANFVNFNVNGNLKGKKIVPMLFIPFIENAFKHATNKKIDGAIDVNIDVSANSIIFSCKNKFEPSNKANIENSGLGNELIKKRLDLNYPNNSNLEVSKIDGVYSVNLAITND